MNNLSNNLHDIAKKYFNNKNSINTKWGICFALTTEIINSYGIMMSLLEELNEPKDTFGSYSTNPSDWEPRAYMCLFLAEYLENK